MPTGGSLDTGGKVVGLPTTGGIVPVPPSPITMVSVAVAQLVLIDSHTS